MGPDEQQSRGKLPTTLDDTGQSPVDEPRYELRLLLGRIEGHEESFALGTDPVHLGRDAGDGQLRLDDGRASRCHAEIHWSEIRNRHWIRDRQSRNGTYLNGASVAREFLTAGDIIRIGATVLRFCAASSVAPGRGRLPPPFVGRSSSLRQTLDRAARVAPTDAHVLILGPTGTGKELIAGEIHRISGRPGAFVAVNGAALPSELVESELFGFEKGAFSGAHAARPGLVRAAEDGTLFLDEVGELGSDVQAKLLRVLDGRSVRSVGATAETPINVRVVAATNRDLAAEAERGAFRADLYARLSEAVVQVAPLRERPEDLEPLWHHFVAQIGQGPSISPSGPAFEVMALHAWPYNVRELRQLARSALLLRPEGGELDVAELPATMRRDRGGPAPNGADPAASPEPLLAPDEAPSKQQLRRLVERFAGNVQEIAAFLGKHRKQVYRWLRRYEIDPDAYRPVR